MTAQLELSLERMRPAGTATISGVFAVAALAEQAIADACSRHPSHAALFQRAFPLLCPPVQFIGLSKSVYTSHAEELLDRLHAGQDLAPGTDAECLVALMAGGTKAPLSSTGSALATRLWRSVFGALPVGIDEGQAEPFPGAADELLANMRHKLRALRGGQ